MTITQTKIENMKREAKKLRKTEGIQYAKALDMAAQRAGFAHWHQVTVQAKGGNDGK